MAGWAELVDNFWRGVPGRSFRCKYHWGDHYQDEVKILDICGEPEVVWLLHGHEIAIYRPGTRDLRVSDCGYATRTTYSRLSAILCRIGFNAFRCARLGAAFIEDEERHMVYMMPPREYLYIDLDTRSVWARKLGWFVALPSDLFYPEFYRLALYLKKKYWLHVSDIFHGSIPEEIRMRLKRKTLERIGMLRMMAEVMACGPTA